MRLCSLLLDSTCGLEGEMIEAIILGIVQGLTEFLPISSSAHIRIFGEFMDGANDPGARFTAITQIGTELAVLIYFRKDIAAILRSWFGQTVQRKELVGEAKSQARMGWLIVIGTIPIVVLGYLGSDIIESNLRSLWLIAITLIVFGVILGLADTYGKRERTLDQLSNRHGILYGVAQALALMPGVSRSGATIAMGRFLGYKREAALRYSFLLALPAVFGSGFYQLQGALSSSDESNVFSLPETAAATTIAFVVGYLVIAWLLKFVSTRSFMPFIIYRITLGTVILILLATGVVSA
jgi:undecaprenyl-diphosphatase